MTLNQSEKSLVKPLCRGTETDFEQRPVWNNVSSNSAFLIKKNPQKNSWSFIRREKKLSTARAAEQIDIRDFLS